MFPWGHAAFGYLLYSAYTHMRRRRVPDDGAVVVLSVSTQLPDLVDKPLSWTFGLTATGKSVGHSFVGLVALVLLVHVVTSRYGRQKLRTVFCLGVCSHLIGDVVEALVEHDPVRFLLWPVLTTRETSAGSILSVLLRGEQGPMAGPEYALVLGGVLLWILDGTPGLFRQRQRSPDGPAKRSK